MNFIKKNRIYLLLILIMLLGAALRFYRLGYQSLWHDELFTLNQADPSLSWKQMFDLLRLDTHPPLYVIATRLSFTLFGYLPWVTRFIAALAGVLGIVTMFKLGKYLAGARTGMIAAALYCMNASSLYYSQEGRGYTLLILLASLSYLYFIKLSQKQNTRDAIYFIIATVLLPYTHYYGLLVVASEGLFAIIFIFNQKQEWKKLVLWFGTSFMVIGLLYIPWLPFLLNIPEMDTFYIHKRSITFPFFAYFEYFGLSLWIVPFIIGLPLVFLINLLKKHSFKNLSNDRAVLFFAFFVVAFLVSNGIPYIASILIKPMVNTRYIIFLLPFYIIFLAYGISLLKNRFISNAVLCIFLVLSLIDTIVWKRTYRVLYKEQVREVTRFISENGRNYPMINEWMAWRHQYYLKKYNYTGKILNYEGSIWPSRTNKEWMVDSIIERKPGYNTDTFWIVAVNEDLPLSLKKREKLDSFFVLIKEAHYINADAWLYGRRKEVHGSEN